MMQLTPWTWRPSSQRRDITRYNRELDNLWDRLAGGFPFESAGQWLPSVDVAQSDGEITVRAELPGLEAQDIDLDISGDILSIRGEKKGREEIKEENYHTRESYYGSFQRTIPLPEPV